MSACNPYGLPEDVINALKEARELAMRNTLAARIPECADFGAIAQNLDWACSVISGDIQMVESMTTPPKEGA